MNILRACIFLAVSVMISAGFKATTRSAAFTVQSPVYEWTDTVKLDVQTGLAEDKNLAIVKANCMGCHSAELIRQNRFSRQGWVAKIRWMQKEHNLWDLGESEKAVLDYLEKYYSPESASSNVSARRAPLRNIKWYKLN